MQGAKNIFHPEDLIKEFFPDAVEPSSAESFKRTIAIFHCEFSSERAPKMFVPSLQIISLIHSFLSLVRVLLILIWISAEFLH